MNSSHPDNNKGYKERTVNENENRKIGINENDNKEN